MPGRVPSTLRGKLPLLADVDADRDATAADAITSGRTHQVLVMFALVAADLRSQPYPGGSQSQPTIRRRKYTRLGIQPSDFLYFCYENGKSLKTSRWFEYPHYSRRTITGISTSCIILSLPAWAPVWAARGELSRRQESLPAFPATCELQVPRAASLLHRRESVRRHV